MTFPRLPQSARLLCAGAALAVFLAGCQSEQEQKIAEARELIRQQQVQEAQSAKPAAQPAAGTPASPSMQTGLAKPDTTAAESGSDDLGLPVYPGAKPVADGPAILPNTGDGIAMALLQTKDPLDKVAAFYQEKMTPLAGKTPINTTNEQRNGNRVVRLTLPRDDGGLQTVQVSEDNGQTVIQLMNVHPRKGGQNVPVPGVSGPGRSIQPLSAPGKSPASPSDSVLVPAPRGSAPGPAAPGETPPGSRRP